MTGSDGGGSPLDGAFWWLPLAVSALAALLALVSIALNARKDARAQLWEYLQLLISSETAATRSIVGTASKEGEERMAFLVSLFGVAGADSERAERDSRATFSEANDFVPEGTRDAVFRMLWIVALAAPAMARGSWVHRLIVWRSTDLYRAQIYQQLNLIIPDLHSAYVLFVRSSRTEGSASLTDAAIDALPKKQRTPGGGTISLERRHFGTSPKTSLSHGGDLA